MRLLPAAEDALPGGKVGYLKWLAKNNSGAFASLLGKVLPTTLAGDSAAPIMHEHKVDLSVYSVEELKTLRGILSKGKGLASKASDKNSATGGCELRWVNKAPAIAR
jgi:hypothetical protein